jgi:sec-independent protein translocase protein TatB
MDSIFGIGLPELFFIAILALIILGPERLPATLRQIARAWGYVRNLGRELTAQFSEEFKDLEDLNPRKLLNDLADEELAKDLKSLTGGKTTSKAKPTTAATARPAANTTTAKPATTKPATSTATKSTSPKPTTAEKTAKTKEPESSPVTPAADADASVEPVILPPTPAETTSTTADSSRPTAASSSESNVEPPVEADKIASSAVVSVNGATEHGESAA